MLEVLICLGLFLLIVCCVSLYYNYKFAIALLKIEDSLTECLDILDERYASVAKILETPLFYDSPQIRQIVIDMQKCQESILMVANVISKVENVDEEESN